MGHAEAPIDLVTTVYAVHEDRVLLVFHAALRRWLAPGGHVETGETPDQAAVREVLEETGLGVMLVSDRAHEADYGADGVRVLARPLGVQLEDIRPGHQHVDLVYAAVADGLDVRANAAEIAALEWFDRDGLHTARVLPNVRFFATRALDLVRELNAQDATASALSLVDTVG
jgi:8-oxo-dGTP pyrophosphatase MutT (NUDIX family)